MVGMVKSPDEQDIPVLSLFASWLPAEGPRAADRQSQPRQMHWARNGLTGSARAHAHVCTHLHSHIHTENTTHKCMHIQIVAFTHHTQTRSFQTQCLPTAQ